MTWEVQEIDAGSCPAFFLPENAFKLALIAKVVAVWRQSFAGI